MMKITEMADEVVIAESLFRNYKSTISYKNNLDKVQLKHHLDLDKLKSSIDQSMTEFGRHPWLSADGTQLRYAGFSLTYNPSHQDQLNPNASSLGTPKNKPEEFFYNSTSKHEKLKNSYFDTYGFIQRTPAAAQGYLNEILNTCKRTIVRSRMMILDGKCFDEQLIKQYQEAPVGDSKFGWHRDEPIHVNLRVNIPITSDDAFIFEMEKEEPYILEPGYAYSWDTNKPHRVWCRKKTTKERYNLIIGVSPWFDYIAETQEWIPNQYYAKKNPIEMLNEGLIFDWLKAN